MAGDSAVTAMETVEMNQKYGKNNSKDVDAAEIEFKILEAMRSLRNGPDCFTFVSVRRMLEEDMGLEKYALEVHKSFVQENLVKCLEEAGNDDASENPQETERKLSEEHEAKNDVMDDTGDYKNRKGSPETGLLTEENTTKRVAKDMNDKGNKEALQSDIRRALRKRSSYIMANAEAVTLASLRRLLEEDLKLEKQSLDPFKKFINKELDEVLQIPAAPKCSTESMGKDLKKNVKSTQSKKQTKETATTVYGKRVAHLISVIKSCGISVPPNIYKRAKQAPEENCEATLIEELEQILAKEGLSSDPSEKEIKEVKNRKAISKELEGLDTSNIVSSSRRRSTTSFAPPPKPKITVESESESDEPEDSENEEDPEEEEEGNEEAEEGSQSEEEEESNNEDDGGEESE